MFQSLIDVVLPVFLVIGAGYVTTRAGYFQSGHIDALMRFTQGFAIPALLFRAIATLDLEAVFNYRLLISFYAGATLSFAAGILGARLIFRRDWEDSVAIGFCCLFSNSLLLGLPITAQAYGPASLVGNYAIIAIHSPFCYGLGITTMEIVRNRGLSGLKTLRAIFTAMFRNALILAILLGFVVNLSGISLPGVFDNALDLFVRSALPVALFALGGALVQYRPEGDLRTIAYVVAVTLVLHPTLVWIFGRGFALPQDLFRSAILTAAMAPGVNAYIFANMYGRAKRVAASSVLLATGASILTVWFWLTLLG